MTSTYARDTRVCAFCETEINTDDTIKNGNKSTARTVPGDIKLTRTISARKAAVVMDNATFR